MIQKPKFMTELQLHEGSTFILDDETLIRYQHLSNCSLRINTDDYIIFENCILSNINFQQADLFKAEFTDVRFEKCDLSNSTFKDAVLHRCEFVECKMIGLNLHSATLTHVSITDCIASFAMLNESRLKEVAIETSSFDKSSFQGSILKQVQLIETNLNQAYLAGTNFKGIDVSSCQLEGVIVNMNELEGLIVSPTQALELSKLMGLVIK